MKRRCAIAPLIAVLLLPATALAAGPQAAQNARPADPETVAAATSAHLSDGLTAEIDGVVTDAMQEWSVPGLALAITVDGEPVLVKGYGDRHAESGLPVTSTTLFPIASLTKPFTAALLAALVDDGLLEWDRPVIEYLPDFRLADEKRTRAITPRDLVTHQSGLPRHDFVWYGADLTSRDLYQRLRYLEPSAPLRGEWQYQNLMFMTAGLLAESVTGESWQDALRERILDPLQMGKATLSLEDLKQRADIAFPYAESPRGTRRVPFRSMDAVGAAGAINANAAELVRFVEMLLNEGTFEGRRVVSAAVTRQLLQPQVMLPESALDPALGTSSYGLGLVLSTYAGRRLAHHEGGVDGFISLLSFLPDDRIGVVVLTNYSGDNPVPWIVTRTIYDRLLQRTPTDWLAYAHDTAGLRENDAGRPRAVTAPVASWRRGPARPLPADYAGSYWHPAYGEVDIVLAGSTLAMRFHGIDARLDAVGANCYRVSEGSLAGLSLTFLANAVNRIDSVAIPWEPEVDDIVFTRRTTADNHDDDNGR